MVKVSNPGILQVRRFFTAQGNVADVIYDNQRSFEEPCHISIH